MNIKIPELSLVLLVGPSGCGKSTFARKHFKSTEIISSDFCRGLVSDDENDQSATKDAFELLHYIFTEALVAGRLTVVDATNVQPEVAQAVNRDREGIPRYSRWLSFSTSTNKCATNAIEIVLTASLGHTWFGTRRSSYGAGLRGLEREGIRYLTIHHLNRKMPTVLSSSGKLCGRIRSMEHGPFRHHRRRSRMLRRVGGVTCTSWGTRWTGSAKVTTSPHPMAEKRFFSET